jgi:hypothetical protein
MSVQELLKEIRALSLEERNQLMHLMVDMLRDETREHDHRLTELRGLGKEIWAGIDAQAHIHQQRDEWDNHA